MTENKPPALSRRKLLAAGGAAILGSAAAAPALIGARRWAESLSQDDAAAGIQLPPGDDPVAMSAAEQRFWTQVLMEHAQFFVFLMPSSRLAGPRGEAENFLGTFSDFLEDARKTAPTRETFAKSNHKVAEQARRFAEWKLGMRKEQASGRLQSLVWPSFFQAAAMEAMRFAQRLDQINAGNTAFERNEVAGFWLSDSSDHAAMVEHLLDPEEHRLAHQAKEMSKKFGELRAAKPSRQGEQDPVLEAARERVRFEATIHEGIQDGRIHSIIQPMMADHMHREGLRFIEEMKRAR